MGEPLLRKLYQDGVRDLIVRPASGGDYVPATKALRVRLPDGRQAGAIAQTDINGPVLSMLITQDGKGLVWCETAGRSVNARTPELVRSRPQEVEEILEIFQRLVILARKGNEDGGTDVAIFGGDTIIRLPSLPVAWSRGQVAISEDGTWMAVYRDIDFNMIVAQKADNSDGYISASFDSAIIAYPMNGEYWQYSPDEENFNLYQGISSVVATEEFTAFFDGQGTLLEGSASGVSNLIHRTDLAYGIYNDDLYDAGEQVGGLGTLNLPQLFMTYRQSDWLYLVGGINLEEGIATYSAAFVDRGDLSINTFAVPEDGELSYLGEAGWGAEDAVLLAETQPTNPDDIPPPPSASNPPYSPGFDFAYEFSFSILWTCTQSGETYTQTSTGSFVASAVTSGLLTRSVAFPGVINTAAYITYNAPVSIGGGATEWNPGTDPGGMSDLFSGCGAEITAESLNFTVTSVSPVIYGG